MGLDMFLTRKKYVGANYEHRGVNGNIDILINNKTLPIDFNKVSYIEESVGYWRKANAIHNWFVKNCQDGVDDCREHYVETDQLEELLNICKEIKKIAKMKKGKIKNGETLKDGKWEPILVEGEYIENVDEIEELLPRTSGFFFGSTEYDEYYMMDINNTIDILTKVIDEEKTLNEQGFYSEFFYQSSW